MMDIIGLDDFKTAFWGLLGMMGVAGIHVGKGVIQAQKDRDVTVHNLDKKLSEYQLKVTEDYAKKTEIARLHDRIDDISKMVNDIHTTVNDLPHKLADLMSKR